MKKYISIIAAVAALVAFSSCGKDQYGTTPGTDTDPYVVVLATGAELPNDPDCDAVIRISANNATSEVYYFAEPVSAKEARGLSDEAYADVVVSNGQKVTLTANNFNGSQVSDFVSPKLFGENALSAVAIGSNGKKSPVYTTTFTGIKWNDVVTGTYTFGSSAIYNTLGFKKKEGVLLQQSDDDPTLYRFKNLYKDGNHLQVKLYPSYTAEDEDGVYTFVRVPAQATGLNHATYGAMSVRDYGYRYNDASYIFEQGYEGGMYADHFFFLYMSVYVSAGNFGGAYDFFSPDE